MYLFEGQNFGEKYDARNLQQILKQVLKKAGITKPVALHWLSHNYTTDLLEAELICASSKSYKDIEVAKRTRYATM